MVDKSPRRIAVTGGGTAGHILPALDFLEAYRSEAGAEGFFIGCQGGMEQRLVPSRLVQLETIPGGPWARQRWKGRVRAVALLLPGIVAARRLLRRERTELVIGTGGYASMGACVAAWTLRVPVVIYEANVEPGLANRLIAVFADLILVSSEQMKQASGLPAVVIGTPTAHVRRNASGVPNFIVLGGSEGSPVLNTEAPRLFAELQRRGKAFTVRHLTGFGATEEVTQAYLRAGVEARVEGFVDDMRPVYANAAFALAAPGALTLAELDACGIPSLLAPTPGTARDHQSSNARAYAQRTGAVLVPGGPWDIPVLASRIEEALGSQSEKKKARATAGGPGTSAGAELVRQCERLLRRLSSAA